MRLFHTSTSPFVRKVLVAAHETGIVRQIEIVSIATSPLEPNAELLRKNPLAKVPALELDDGTLVYDSHVIVDHLDSLHGGTRLIPASGRERLLALRLEALADGILDAGILVRYEEVFRAKDKIDPKWLGAQAGKVLSALDALEADAAGLEGPLCVGKISLGCALGWLEFREPIPDVRKGRDRLFAWWDRLRERPSFVATTPHA